MSCGGSEPICHGSCLTTLVTSLRPLRRPSWIMTGVVAVPATAALPGIDPLPHMQPLIPSDRESEVGGSDTELPMSKQLLSKVRQADNIEHMLDKGEWATTPAMHRGWEIFVDVSLWIFCLRPRLIWDCSGPLRGSQPGVPMLPSPWP